MILRRVTRVVHAVKPKPITNIDDPRYLKAIAHPLRVRILALLKDRQMSPKELAERFDVTLGAMAYHVRLLSQLGLIELVGTQQRRGATEHFYRALEHPRFSDAAWERLEPIAKQRLLSAMLRQIGEYTNSAAAAGGFDRPDAHFTRTGMKLDERGWTDLSKATKKWLEQAGRIEDASARRLERSADEPLDVGLVLLLFEAVPFGQDPVAPKKPAGRRRRTADSAATA
jgi:DNA-binding transcriptional ArsR family regulator